MKISKNTVSKWIINYKKENILNENHVLGRKPILTETHKEFIKTKIKETNTLKIKDIRNLLIENYNIKIGETCIRNALKSMNFVYYFLPKKVHLSEKHINQRLHFALSNIDRDWNKVIFSDEVTIFKDKYSHKFWFNSEENILYKPTYKHTIKRNIWACINTGGQGTIFIFKDNMNTDLYIDILIKCLCPIWEEHYIFQQDNDPKHTAKQTQQFFSTNGINVLKWCSNSPDLNPIENIWKLLKESLSYETDINDSNFDQKIIDHWHKIKFESIYNCIASMPIRLTEVIKSNGSIIKY